jgi:hypothetical protein
MYTKLLAHHYRYSPFTFKRFFILIGLIIFLLFIYDFMVYPKDYHYSKMTAANGVVLHIIRTSPGNVHLQSIETNVTATDYYGINGGFFWEGALLSIAVIDGLPIKGKPGEYGSGWYNTGTDMKLKRGTLVWDGSLKQFSVQVVTHAGQLKVMNKHNFWAQGGVSMSMGHDQLDLERTMILENMPSYNETHLRTGIVYDRQKNVYLIVTPTPCTVEQFRSAILEKLNRKNYLVDGIFLDGDGSSQMQARYVRLKGDHRQVFQMLRLKN